MAFFTVFFRFFFLHVQKRRMIVIIGQVGRGFRRCAPEKVEESGTNRYKQDIGNEYGRLIFFHLHDHWASGEIRTCGKLSFPTARKGYMGFYFSKQQIDFFQ